MHLNQPKLGYALSMNLNLVYVTPKIILLIIYKIYTFYLYYIYG